MAIKRPDIYEHNNPNNAFVDSNFVRGGFRTSVADLSALYALSGKTDQLKAHSTVVYVTGTTKYYILKDISNVGNANGWEEFVTGTGAGVITGATNGLTVSSKDIKLGGNLCEGTTIYTCEYGLYYAASPALNSYIQTCLSNTYGLNTYQVLFDDTGSTKSNHFCMTSTSGELYFANDSNNCSSIYGDTSKLCLINKTAGASKIVILDGNALNYGNNYASSFVARSLPDVAWITACTSNALSNYYTKTQINNYTGTTAPNIYVTKSTFSYYTGTTIPNNYYNKTQINYFTGTTLPANYYTKIQINSYTGNTNNRITTIESKYITGATNGLSIVGKQVKLGGSLNGETIISGSSQDLYLGNSASPLGLLFICSEFGGRISSNISGEKFFVINNTSTKLRSSSTTSYSEMDVHQSDGIKLTFSGTSNVMHYNSDYSSLFTARSIPDVAWVTGRTSTSGIQTANNGLTKDGTNVRLGGTLTGNTSLIGNYTLNVCGGAKLNTTCGYQVSGTTILKTSTNDINSIFIGNGAGTLTNTGNNNIGFGCNVLTSITTGYNNIGIGNKSLNKNCTGYGNIGIGNLSLSANTSGVANIGIGACTLYSNTTGNNNVAIGTWNLLVNTSGSGNVGLGTCSLMTNTSGTQNIGIGSFALRYNTIGCCNIALGSNSLVANTIGCNNIAIGRFALCSNTSGQTNIAIGQYAGRANVGGSKSIFIGECAGYNETASGKLYIATGATTTLIYGDFITNTVTLPTLKLCTTPSVGATSDNILVWNSSDNCVKQIVGTSVLSSAITGATNGLTKVGQTVILGGELTGNTCIYSTNVTNCAYINFDEVNSSISTYTKGGNISLCSVPNASVGGKICITATSGMTYAADYSANYTNRTIVDKEYVDKKMSIINVRNTYGVCPFYINETDNFIGVSGYTVGNCACLYLIPTPPTGQKIIISDIQGQALDYPITIDGNGKFINGNGAAMINTDYGSITFVFNGYFWSAVAFVN